MDVRAMDQTFRQHEGDDYLLWFDDGDTGPGSTDESELADGSTGFWLSDPLVSWAFWLDK
jgi:hypothetical protein